MSGLLINMGAKTKRRPFLAALFRIVTGKAV